MGSNSNSGGLFAQGLVMVMDGQARYVREGEECFLRLQNFENQGDFQEVGVPYAPTGTAGAANQTGFTDILIEPPPIVTDIPDRDIGLSGGKLMFGARTFLISDTFVQNIMQQYPNIPDNSQVWRSWDGLTPVIGIVYSNQMFSIEDVLTRELGGRIISWKLNCNAAEQPLVAASQPTLIP
jgi:hypothetical protein